MILSLALGFAGTVPAADLEMRLAAPRLITFVALAFCCASGVAPTLLLGQMIGYSGGFAVGDDAQVTTSLSLSVSPSPSLSLSLSLSLSPSVTLSLSLARALSLSVSALN